MPWKWYDSTVVKITDESPTTKRFWLELNGEEPFAFKAGQFITMDLPISDKRLLRWRSYSIANAPHEEDKLLEFCIVNMKGGAATHYLFETVQVGTALRFKGPDGAFTLKEGALEKDLVFVCTGTGVAPFRSMIWDIFQKQLSHRNIHLIYGTRYVDNLLYRDEFERLQQELPGFKYSVAVSREENIDPSAFPFEISKGYVHQLYLDQYATPRPDIDFYLCGWSNMIDDAVANLLVKLGFDKSQIHYELYG